VLVVVTTGESTHRRLPIKLVDELEAHPEFADVYISRVNQNEWIDPEKTDSEFAVRFKKNVHKLRKLSLNS
jgi:hypothetical protein